ncbi:SLC13 family permease [Coraliomargarita sp. SDUM461004]|uniref:SLC13 family permease n=1 Tax=Thalassobacterium sedimentorum TaxID=3041258 RepID=A0ABU1AKY4_9BACT|nr:SLC13 family permease [Coraliomargarita sp. SDUM461004]MDQ8195367.1 SLC13 family permease [Coraliomargarita sp. SDUM461004]
MKSPSIPPRATQPPTKEPLTPSKRESFNRRALTGLILAPLGFILILLAPTPEGMSIEAQRAAAVAFIMAILWICETIPIPITSLLPIVLFPSLGIMPTSQATAPYGSHLVFLFMGGFIIALSMQRWDLHRRLALHVIRLIGFSPSRLVLGFMLATALLSAFVSNTATTVMMLPIGLAVITQASAALKQSQSGSSEKALHAFSINLMLGIAYAASIGGLATLIGTPPNTVLAGYLSKTYNYEITFANWLLVGVPMVALFLPICWLWLTRICNPMKGLRLPDSDKVLKQQIAELGVMNTGEKWTLAVFSLTALGWLFRPQIAQFFPDPSMLKDSSIAIAGAICLFFLPTNLRKHEFVMNWEWASKLPWGVLLLFGGGFALAQGFAVSGLANWIVNQVGMLSNLPIVALILCIALIVTFLTELTSNTATATILMPVLAGVAIGLGQSPLLLIAPAALSASCAFMLPVATPPNAIVFSSGHVSIPQMMKAGFGLNVIGIFLITLITYIALIPAFEIVLNIVPTWAQ